MNLCGFAYQIYATTKTPAGGNTIKYQQVLYDSGLSAYWRRRKYRLVLKIVEKPEFYDGTSWWCLTYKMVDKIKGKNIVIDATNQLYLQGRKIQVGHEQKGRTEDFK